MENTKNRPWSEPYFVFPVECAMRKNAQDDVLHFFRDIGLTEENELTVLQVYTDLDRNSDTNTIAIPSDTRFLRRMCNSGFL